MADRSHLPYRPCVGVLMFNAAGQVFVARRIGLDDAWQMPQGGIDGDETPHAAGLRELAEEIGTASVEIVGETAGWITYDFPADLNHGIRKKWRGQRQKWFACRFTGSEDEIDLDTEHPEFDAWKWVEMQDLVDLIVAFKRDSYAAVVAELSPLVDQALTRPGPGGSG